MAIINLKNYFQIALFSGVVTKSHFYQWPGRVPLPVSLLTLGTINLKDACILLNEIVPLLMECSDYHWGQTPFLYWLLLFIACSCPLTIVLLGYLIFAIDPIEGIYVFLKLNIYNTCYNNTLPICLYLDVCILNCLWYL